MDVTWEKVISAVHIEREKMQNYHSSYHIFHDESKLFLRVLAANYPYSSSKKLLNIEYDPTSF